MVNAPDANSGFAVWITGLPASGKSTVAVALAAELRVRGLDRGSARVRCAAEDLHAPPSL